MENVLILDDISKMDFEKVTKMLSNTFWSPGIKTDEIIKGANNSALVVGAFLKDGEQIGYGRVVSDKTRFAYILDMCIDENYRRKGIGQKIIHHILSHYELSDVYQWLLITKDAHDFYAKFGFKPVSRPLDLMEIRNPRPSR